MGFTGKAFGRTISAVLGLFFVLRVFAEVAVVDDVGQKVALTSPAMRVVSLAPNLTEILFFIGAGEQVVGVVEYSDFPRQPENCR